MRLTGCDLNVGTTSKTSSGSESIVNSMITLSDAAAKRVKEMIKDSDHVGLRPGVQGGGCSGFSYTLKFSDGARENDKVIESKGVALHIDKKSYLYLIGTEIDYVEEDLQAGFKFVNPNAKRTCGCGESFSV